MKMEYSSYFLFVHFPFLRILIDVYEDENAISILQTRDWRDSSLPEFDSFCWLFSAAKPSHNYSNALKGRSEVSIEGKCLVRSVDKEITFAELKPTHAEKKQVFAPECACVARLRKNSCETHSSRCIVITLGDKIMIHTRGRSWKRMFVKRYFGTFDKHQACDHRDGTKRMLKGSRQTPFGSNIWEISIRDLLSGFPKTTNSNCVKIKPWT